MLQAINVSLQYGSRVLFKDVNLKFTKGNCYGVIGANGAGKSTFLKILSGVLEPNKGEVIKDKDERLSVLNQDQYAFDNETVIRTVLLGNKRIVDIMDEQEALYSKADFSEEDGIRVGELQMEFAELNGWEAESDAKILLNGLGISDEKADCLMKDLDSKEKVKVLLAQALFGNPDILILDEVLGVGDITFRKKSKEKLKSLMESNTTVLLVSHSIPEIRSICDKAIWIEKGKVREIGEVNYICDKYTKEAKNASKEKTKKLKPQRF